MDSSSILHRLKHHQPSSQQSPMPTRLRSGSQNSASDKFVNVQNKHLSYKFNQMQRSAVKQARSKPSLQEERKSPTTFEQLRMFPNNIQSIRPTFTTFTKESREQTDFDIRNPTFDNSAVYTKKPGVQIGTL